VLVSTHPGLRDYVSAVLHQLGGASIGAARRAVLKQLRQPALTLRCCCLCAHTKTDWLLEGTLQRLVLVVASVASGEVLERWVFNVDMDKADACVQPASCLSPCLRVHSHPLMPQRGQRVSCTFCRCQD
jgi:hypothetical protein